MRVRISLVVLAMVGAALFAASSVSAQSIEPTCQGQEANIPPTLVPGGINTYRGTPGDDVIVGSSEADLILGRGGDDLICALGGPDEIRGGSGNDIIYAGAGKDDATGGKGRDRIFGGSGDDDIWGNRGRDNIRGGKGDDHLRGNSGDDVLRGNSGDDILRGNQGSTNKGVDICKGGPGKDRRINCGEVQVSDDPPSIEANPGDTKNCSDFDTYEEAKAWFDRFFDPWGDVAKLDQDNDGEPCETLPGGPS